MAALYSILNAITETSDVVWALYNSLPWQVRSFKGEDGKWHPIDWSIQDRIERIYENAHLIDPGKFIENLVKNEIGDAIAGKTGQMGKDAVRSAIENGLYNRPVGLTTGPAL